MSSAREVITQTVFRLGPHVRYVAFGQGQAVSTAQRDDVQAPSDPGSDFYEELLVNPRPVDVGATARGPGAFFFILIQDGRS